MSAAMTDAPLERAVFLLGEAVGATLPDTYGCCSEDALCRDHQQAQDAADLIDAILCAAKDAATGDEAGRRIAALLRGTPEPEITPGQREFAAGIVTDSIRWLLPADDEEDKIRAARKDVRERIRNARTVTEIGIAMTGGNR